MSQETTVPAARIEFSPEDRQWIADRIQEILASGQLTLGSYGQAFEEGFAKLCGVEPRDYLLQAATVAIDRPGTVLLPHDLLPADAASAA